jgi:hypothetical protein
MHCSGESPVQPFALDWTDAKLAVNVRVRQRESGEVWVLVDSLRSDSQDETVSIALVGPEVRRMHRLTVRLDKPRKDGGWCGSACFGQLERIRKEVGSPVTVVPFLLETPIDVW